MIRWLLILSIPAHIACWSRPGCRRLAGFTPVARTTLKRQFTVTARSKVCCTLYGVSAAATLLSPADTIRSVELNQWINAHSSASHCRSWSWSVTKNLLPAIMARRRQFRRRPRKKQSPLHRPTLCRPLALLPPRPVQCRRKLRRRSYRLAKRREMCRLKPITTSPFSPAMARV